MENILRRERKYNVTNNILASENAIIDRLLCRSQEMRSVYEELSTLPAATAEELLKAFVSVAAFWSPDAAAQLRQKKRELASLNQTIQKLASELSAAIMRRHDLANESGLQAYDDYHVMHWLDRAGDNNHLYQSYLQKSLHRAKGQFDLKYWPAPHQLVQAISDYADESEIRATDSWTTAAIATRKHSTADCLRTLLTAMAEVAEHSHVVRTVALSDETLATLFNCLLDLEPKALKDAAYIKRARQAIREREEAESNALLPK